MSRYTHPLAQGLSTVLDREADDYRVGVAGRKGPLRWVVEDASGWRQGGVPFLPPKNGTTPEWALWIIFSFRSPIMEVMSGECASDD